MSIQDEASNGGPIQGGHYNMYLCQCASIADLCFYLKSAGCCFIFFFLGFHSYKHTKTPSFISISRPVIFHMKENAQRHTSTPSLMDHLHNHLHTWVTTVSVCICSFWSESDLVEIN